MQLAGRHIASDRLTVFRARGGSWMAIFDADKHWLGNLSAATLDEAKDEAVRLAWDKLTATVGALARHVRVSDIASLIDTLHRDGIRRVLADYDPAEDAR